MASELYVETLKGLTSGANANKVIIPSGQTLDASAGGFTTPAGHVIQVVSFTTSTTVATTGTSFTDTGVTASITPTNTSSKILILVSQAIGHSSDTDGQNQYNLAITNSGNTVLFGSSNYDQFRVKNALAHSWQASLQYLDSPSTTNELTYKTRMRFQLITGNTTLYAQYSTAPSTITLMEIAG